MSLLFTLDLLDLRGTGHLQFLVVDLHVGALEPLLPELAELPEQAQVEQVGTDLRGAGLVQQGYDLNRVLAWVPDLQQWVGVLRGSLAVLTQVEVVAHCALEPSALDVLLVAEVAHHPVVHRLRPPSLFPLGLFPPKPFPLGLFPPEHQSGPAEMLLKQLGEECLEALEGEQLGHLLLEQFGQTLPQPELDEFIDQLWVWRDGSSLLLEELAVETACVPDLRTDLHLLGVDLSEGEGLVDGPDGGVEGRAVCLRDVYFGGPGAL